MIWVGICGSSGSGKSTVCRIFEEHGFAWLDCDAIYHDLVSAPSECLSAIGERFGREVIADGRLDRALLREIVFSDSGLSAELGRITHPYVINELHRRSALLEEKGVFFCLIDAPMLFESGLDSDCELVIGVTADEAVKVKRLALRDGISEKQALDRWKNQLSDRVLKEKCDIIINNSGSLEELEKCCKEAINKIASAF